MSAGCFFLLFLMSCWSGVSSSPTSRSSSFLRAIQSFIHRYARYASRSTTTPCSYAEGSSTKERKPDKKKHVHGPRRKIWSRRSSGLTSRVLTVLGKEIEEGTGSERFRIPPSAVWGIRCTYHRQRAVGSRQNEINHVAVPFSCTQPAIRQKVPDV